MTVLPILGSIGIGLVWGWLLGSLTYRVRRIRYAVLLVCLATLALGVVLVGFATWSSLPWFISALAIASLTHIGWRQRLTQR